jgi:hypothetical protein
MTANDSPSDSGVDHPAWRTLASAGVGYGLVLLAMFVALFVLPFLVFLVL